MIISALLIFSYLFFICYFLKKTKALEIEKKDKKILLIFALIVFFASVLFFYLYFRQENTIYVWDEAGYYRKTLECINIIKEDLFPIDYFLTSFSLDYTYVISFMLSPIMMFIGNSFLRYVVSIYGLFMLPFQMIVCLIVLKIINKYNLKTSDKIMVLSLIALFVNAYIPLVFGYADIAGLVLLALVVLHLSCENEGVIKITESIILGLMLLFMVFVRRWYAFFAVTYFSVIYLVEIIYQLKTKKYKKIINITVNYFISGIFALLILVICFHETFNLLTKNYSTIYAVANLGTFFGDIQWFVNYYGLFYCGLAILGFVYGGIIKKDKLAYMSLFAVLTIFVTFTRIQDFGIHHYYLTDLFMIVMITYAFIFFGQTKFKNTLVIMLCISMLAFSTIFSRNSGIVTKAISPIVSKIREYPRVRNDINEIQSIDYLLNSLVESEYEYIYVLSSSHLFNDDTLRNCHLPYNLDPLPNLVNTHHWDLRDGVYKDFFKAKYVLVAEPYQLMYGKENQHVVWDLIEFIKYDEEISKHYQNLTEFKIDNDVKITLYKLTERVPENLIDKVNQHFYDIYYEDTNFTFNY